MINVINFDLKVTIVSYINITILNQLILIIVVITIPNLSPYTKTPILIL